MDTTTTDSGRPRILVAHSHIGILALMKEYFMLNEYTGVTIVTNTDEVMRRITVQPPIEFLVVSEVLPGPISCHDVIRTIKEGPQRNMRILLLLPHHPSSEEALAWGRLGVAGVMSHLCTQSEFMTMVREVLNK